MKKQALTQAGQYLLTNEYEQVRHVITCNYPFKRLESTRSSYTDKRCNKSGTIYPSTHNTKNNKGEPHVP